jgi:hypothetical protein
MHIRLRLQQAGWEPGQTLVGECTWKRRDGENGPIELVLSWETSGKGEKDVGGVVRERVPANAPSGEAPFRFELPDAPWSVSGTLVSIVWSVEAFYDGGVLDRAVFALAPEGRAIEL